MKFFIVLFAIVAVVSAGGHYAQQIHVAGNPPIPGVKAAPLVHHGNDHTTRIHYSGVHVGHPHLVGVEEFKAAPHYEPGWTNVAVHGHGHGWH